ncbi:phosphoribosylanthranilate isomerase [Sporosarcina thermotolerans]|uniref:N-(5'-phosphoribosyl)anthranilate isomerase n=1 Tax=Sporosarcina thermotolerans TaxID=633404 RepID=A0AAW9A674_9BACL|nr:phosphoribosylanthranilate isomerase [Sporosarcina thermotolerans]MDW0116602.1 phosphoribosylanthranilate isomerase [Sporosarcina thermotolerans]
MTKVKICGLMEPPHVQAAVEAGVDAVGFVFAPSRRRVAIEQAKELARLVPDHVIKIGVFVNAEREEMEQAFLEVPLDYIQYHGDETVEFMEFVALPSIKVLSVRDVEDVKRAKAVQTEYVLFDTPGTEFRGGSGEAFDWSLLNGDLPRDRMILAGGLNAQNVKEAIRQVRPFMVDVSSGVEIDRRKDEALIREFIRAVKEEESGDGN